MHEEIIPFLNAVYDTLFFKIANGTAVLSFSWNHDLLEGMICRMTRSKTVSHGDVYRSEKYDESHSMFHLFLYRNS